MKGNPNPKPRAPTQSLRKARKIAEGLRHFRAGLAVGFTAVPNQQAKLMEQYRKALERELETE